MSNETQTPPEMTLKEVNLVLSQTIKKDDTNKSLLFLGMLSAYTENSQLNITLNAPSSSGKTYITQEVAKLFPKDDKIEFSNLTPTALLYSKGEQDKERGAKIINLERKIIIFYEQPDSALQATLRPLLSHDSKELIYQRTNRNKSGENRAEKIILRGFPATVFCSASQHLDEQEATRALMLSPEITPEKIESAIDATLLKNADPTAFAKRLEADPERTALMERIKLIRDEKIDDIRTPDPEIIKQRFREFIGGSFKPRNMRDIAHLTQIIKNIALLNIWYREKDDEYYANEQDMEEAFRLWGDIAKTQALNINQYLYDFYCNYIIGAYRQLSADRQRVGVSRKEVIEYYQSRTNMQLSDSTLRRDILANLNNAGLILLVPHPSDRRQLLILPNKTIETEGCMG